MAGLGDKCAKSLAEDLFKLYKAGSGSILITKVAKRVLAANNRWYVKIGQKALLSEVNTINRAARKAQCQIAKKGKVTMYKEEATSLLGTLFGFAGDVVSGMGNAAKEGFDEALGKADKVRLEKDHNNYMAILDKLDDDVDRTLNENPEILSSGAGGFRKRVGTKFLSYAVLYPTITFESSDEVKNFTKNMQKCKLVPNSLFCAAGSAKIYKSALGKMK